MKSALRLGVTNASGASTLRLASRLRRLRRRLCGTDTTRVRYDPWRLAFVVLDSRSHRRRVSRSKAGREVAADAWVSRCRLRGGHLRDSHILKTFGYVGLVGSHYGCMLHFRGVDMARASTKDNVTPDNAWTDIGSPSEAAT